MKDHEWLTIFTCSSRKRYPFNNPAQSYEGYDFFYTVSGVAHYLLEDHTGQIRMHELSPGEFILLDAGIPHNLSISEEDNVHMILMNLRAYEPEDDHFSLKHLKKISPETAMLFQTPGLVMRSKDHNGQLCAQLTMLLQAVRTYQHDPLGKPIIDLLLTSSLIEMVCLKARHSKDDFHSQYVNSAVSYLEQHYYETIRISAVADAVGVHPAYLQRLFHQKTGTTIMAYTNSLRIESAKRQLESMGSSILDVALNCGFSNRQHFGRVFRQETGMSPAQYRKKLKRNAESNYLMRTDTQQNGKP